MGAGGAAVVSWSVVRGPPATRLLLGRGGPLWPQLGEAPDQADDPGDDQEDPEDAGAEGHDPGNHGDGGAPPHTLRTGTGVLVVVFMPGAPPSALVWARSGSDEPRGAHTHALRPRAPRSAVRAAPAACAAPCVLFGVVGFSKAARIARPLGRPWPHPALASTWHRPVIHSRSAASTDRPAWSFSILAVIFLYSL